LAEDSDDDELLFRYAFERAGLHGQLLVARDGDETIAYLQGKGQFADRQRFPLPKALFLDLALRKKSGWEVLQWVRDQPEFDLLLIVVLTGSARAGDVRRAYRMGANFFLEKPCNRQDLVNLASAFPAHWSRRPETATASSDKVLCGRVPAADGGVSARNSPLCAICSD
jgi:CheY-like chemotaxis protein